MAAEQFVVRLGWSVPLPAEGAQMTSDQIARIIGTGGTGGVITISGCSDCQVRGEYSYGISACRRRAVATWIPRKSVQTFASLPLRRVCAACLGEPEA